MKSDSPAKKHHFWILFGLAPLFTLIGACTMTSSVGGKIEEKQKDIKGALDSLGKKANPKPKSLISEAELALGEVGKRKDLLHKFNWDRQKALYTWPAGSPAKLKPVEKLNLKFGDALPNDEGQFDEFRDPNIYLNEYSTLRGKGAPKDAKGTGMADRIAPTQFLGGWQARLRYVGEWKDSAIEQNELWLAMEDLWVQRSLLSAVKAVNDDSAAFRRAKREANGTYTADPTFDDRGNKIDGGRAVPTPDAEKTKAAFRSRTWAVELEAVTEGTSRRLVGKLVNLTDKLQLLGNGNTMKLNVWFSKAPTAQPLEFKVGGEYLAGFGATKRENGADVPANEMPVVPLGDHIIPVALQGADFEIARVEQVFDVRTVPIKRIDGLALGYLDSRSAAAALKQPEFIKDPPAADPNAGTGMGPGVGMGPMGMGPGLGPVGPPGGGPGRPGAEGGTGGAPAVGGAIVGPLSNRQLVEYTKKRYLDVTKEVRRMPVAMVLVVDQTYIQDVLLAFSNSPLRFQITQVSWTRFRGALAGIAPSSGGTGPGSEFEVSRGSFGFSGGADPDAVRPGGSSLGPPRPGPGGPIGPIGPMGPGVIGPPGGMGPGFEGNQPQGGAVSESQITSGLVELSIYGIVSLYEKYVDPKEAEAAAKEKEKEKEKGANPPMPADPKGGKSRRRARR